MRRVVLLIVALGLFGVGTAAGAAPAQMTPEPTTDTTEVQPPDDGDPAEPDPPEPAEPVITQQDVSSARSIGEAAALEIRRRIAAIASERVAAAVEIRDLEAGAVETSRENLVGGTYALQESGKYLDQIQFSYRELVDNLIAARRDYATSLLYSYLQEENLSIEGDLETKDGMEDAASDIYLEFVLNEKTEQMVESQKQLDGSSPAILRLADEQGEARLDLDDLRDLKIVAQKRFAESQVVVNGATALAYDWQFPVSGDGYNFIDSFLYPRYANGKYDHAHQGADIFAPYGTPLVAVERGILFKVGIGRIGGIKLWVLGESGTAYYYAHMSAFADISANGVLVEPGQVVGFVGDSGNARGTPPHVHFEVHPEAGKAVNPTAILRYAQERDGNG